MNYTGPHRIQSPFGHHKNVMTISSDGIHWPNRTANTSMANGDRNDDIENHKLVYSLPEPIFRITNISYNIEDFRKSVIKYWYRLHSIPRNIRLQKNWREIALEIELQRKVFISLRRLSSYFDFVNRRELQRQKWAKLNHREQKCIPPPSIQCVVFICSLVVCSQHLIPSNRNRNEIYGTLRSLVEPNSGACEIGWCESSGVFVLQLRGDEMTDELTEQGKLRRDRNRLEKLNVFIWTYYWVILLCSLNGYFIFILVDSQRMKETKKSNQIPFRFQLTARMLYQIWYYVARRS